MTFKEKLEQEHPEKVCTDAMGGCYGCPSDFGYEDDNGCKRNCDDKKCTKCWNREIPVPMTAEEVWEIAKRIVLPASDSGSLKASELREIFDSDIETYILKNFTPQEAKAKLDEWESKQIRVGDVIFCFGDCDDDWKYNEEHYGVVTGIYNSNYQVLMKNGDVNPFKKSSCKKTGKHIDIQSVLDQIGGDKDE